MMDEEKRMKKGKVYLIGAGPGDPELFTLKGKRCLEKADVIVGDYLADKRILRFANKNAEYIYVGKSCGSHTMTQQDISRLLTEKGKEGKIVARLKGGDPFVFGRGGEEIEVLRAAGVDFEEVPGVTSAIAAPAYAGIPVTHRKVAASFAVITGHEDPTKDHSLGKTGGRCGYACVSYGRRPYAAYCRRTDPLRKKRGHTGGVCPLGYPSLSGNIYHYTWRGGGSSKEIWHQAAIRVYCRECSQPSRAIALV